MFEPPPSPRRRALLALGLAVACALGWHLWVGDAHFNPAEEGYLWYGTWRTGLGELPLRDFQSYDPGRYLACAGLGKLFGSGLLGLRRSIAVFHGLGIFFGLLAASRATRRDVWLLPIAVLLGLWMFPRHKVFEGAVALASTWAGVRLLERPTRGRHLAAGVVVGLAGFFGRNHGLYAAVGIFTLLAVSGLRRRAAGQEDGRSLAGKGGAWAGGIVLGYAPMLLLFLAPGFGAGFVESMRLLVRLGSNIPSPWLWPWRLEPAGPGLYPTLVQLGTGAAYLLPVSVLPLAGVLLLRSRAEELPHRALLLSAGVLGACYIHHAAVRSDVSHLAQAFEPTLLAFVGAVALLAQGSRRRVLAGRAAGALVGGLLLVAAYENNPSLIHVGRAELVEADMAGDTLRFLPQHAEYYTRLQRILGARLGPGERLFIAPSKPGFYPLLGRRSPSWWIYFFVAGAPEEEQDAIVRDLAGVEWVLIVDQAIAGLEELRFRNSYPRVWEHVQRAYRRVPTPGLDPSHLLYRLIE